MRQSSNEISIALIKDGLLREAPLDDVRVGGVLERQGRRK
jgi:hypothetical protein